MSYLSRLRNMPERMRARYYPRLAEYKLNRATITARIELSTDAPIQVLIDNSVLGLAVTHETRWIDFKTFGAAVRVPVYGKKNETDDHKQASYLTGLVHLAKLGFIKPWLSAELVNEQFRQPAGLYRGYGLFDHSLFSGVELESIDGHQFPTLGPRWMKLPTPVQQQRKRIAESGNRLFQDLHQLLGPKNDQDAWHITTAEERGLFCFLTWDQKLLKTVKQRSRKEPLNNLRTRIMSPGDLGQHLGVVPVSPLYLSYGGRDAMVRTDFTMPSERRRPRKEYRRP